MTDSGPAHKHHSVLFNDRRSKRVVFVSHCILNQNAMIDGLPSYPDVVREVVDAIRTSGCSMVQLDCPELMYLGLDRRVDMKSARTIESEDTRVRILMEKRAGRSYCKKIAEHITFQVKEYIRNGFTVAGVLGTNASPTCGVETTWSDGKEVSGPGVLIRELKDAFARHRIEIPVRGINLNDPAEAVKVTHELTDVLS